MVFEYERKWLLAKGPEVKELTKRGFQVEILKIKQWYFEGNHERIRQTISFGDIVYEWFYKEVVGNGKAIEEVRVLEEETFKEYLAKANKCISKTRTVVKGGLTDHKFEFDKFIRPGYADMHILEIEFESEEAMAKFQMSPDLKKVVIMEVTGIKDFLNFNLARTI